MSDANNLRNTPHFPHKFFQNMRTIALIVFLAFVATINASLTSSNIFRGARPIIKFCDSHCNEACDRLQVQSDFRMKCENACRWSCDHKRNTHLQPAVMSDAKFFKKVFKKIKGVVKKVTQQITYFNKN
jgi:hypothetical protein